ncbi:unnamed protein product [Didymodactylos carnosus]|uniref:Uncharacterized protein n=1 Tax=Didymodactylos carnosus TaxID=1234261 RepID=A0A8S2DDC3_9BILA|nr:unnamed protein product [Didymodactylos carnosus]CAF3660063.1 unnamed protein product [Didymodactylos carnosus]
MFTHPCGKDISKIALRFKTLKDVSNSFTYLPQYLPVDTTALDTAVNKVPTRNSAAATSTVAQTVVTATST